MTEQEQRLACIEEAKSWLGTPFQFCTSLKHVGVACGPFLIACYKPYYTDMCLTLPIPPVFPRDWHCHTQEERFENVVLQFATEIQQPQPGDVALFRLGSPDRPLSHGAFIIHWPLKLIHAMYRSGVEYATVDRLPLRRNLAKFYSPWAFKK